MKTKKQSNDRREIRAERQEKLGVPCNSQPGQTLSAHDPALRTNVKQSKGESAISQSYRAQEAHSLHTSNKTSGEKVHLRHEAPHAKSVIVIGTFNNWEVLNSVSLIPHNDGAWAIDLELPIGLHEYKFIVDGEWVEDPHARESISNPYGSRNSVLHVQSTIEDEQTGNEADSRGGVSN